MPAENDLDQLKREAAEAQQRADAAERTAKKLASDNRQLLIDREIERYAQGKFRSPDAVPRMIDRKRIKIDEDGIVVGAKAAVDAVLEEFPELAYAPANRGGTPPRPSPRPGVPQPMFPRPTPVAPRYRRM
jgi:hypothetical protein